MQHSSPAVNPRSDVLGIVCRHANPADSVAPGAGLQLSAVCRRLDGSDCSDDDSDNNTHNTHNSNNTHNDHDNTTPTSPHLQGCPHRTAHERLSHPVRCRGPGPRFLRLWGSPARIAAV
jgi:hypothetical protein